MCVRVCARVGIYIFHSDSLTTAGVCGEAGAGLAADCVSSCVCAGTYECVDSEMGWGWGQVCTITRCKHVFWSMGIVHGVCVCVCA